MMETVKDTVMAEVVQIVASEEVTVEMIVMGVIMIVVVERVVWA